LSTRDWPSHPPYIDAGYKSTALRGPNAPLIPVADRMALLHEPVYGATDVGELDSDLTQNARTNGEPLGERMVVTGRVMDTRGQPVVNTLVEIWQANASGRYVHKVDQHNAPLDPNFAGAGRTLTDGNGVYRFITIKPGAYPWGNHPNAWRPQHIHFSLFGPSFASRLITQMYFPGDPLIALDPICQSTPKHAIHRLIADFSLEVTQEGFALGYVFDIVVREGGAL
jgi:protocatechuate 3,4-dioxygenase, beta subunit